MIGDTNSSVKAPVVKIVSAWGAAGGATVATKAAEAAPPQGFLTSIGLTTWAETASFFAALYTLLLIVEWLWRRSGRPFCEKMGWLQRLNRRKSDKRVRK
jgi:hypothetical protein